MNTHYLQNILDDIPFDNLPVQWTDFDLGTFSHTKSLYQFQKEGLENALKWLWSFYGRHRGDKTCAFGHYENNGLTENLSYSLKNNHATKTVKYLLEYDKDYPVEDNSISFAHFVNRMSFWMATGAGKTLVIVKMIQLLGALMERGQIPQYDVLFLAHREDLLAQFQHHVDEFNAHNSHTPILLKNLREYEQIKYAGTPSLFTHEITVFYYRSDLISDTHKEKQVDFKNYDDNGKWYILLDEAHKGDRNESIRQMLYSILSRNGFLFNFSATFTDPRDYATCAFNFNLSKFIQEGYGKHIYISRQEAAAFRIPFSAIEKQKIVLKALVLHTYICRALKRIRAEDGTLYHRPLLLTLVNSVHIQKTDTKTKDADLILFFKELERVARQTIEARVFESAKEELIAEFRPCPQYIFEHSPIDIDCDALAKISHTDILHAVFNASDCGKIEVLKIPGNKKEIVLKLKSSEKPFALIKIGNISGWLKDTLAHYEIIESFDNQSVFAQISHDDSDINILMGSRAFYEGWDSNRPNIVLFINIGVGSKAKKFVLQAVGRGVRIEPQKDKRKRLLPLLNDGQIEASLFNKVKEYILPIESLFIFGTNAQNLNEIMATLHAEKQEKNIGELFIANRELQNRLLLVPVYKESSKRMFELTDMQKYTIHREDFTKTRALLQHIGDKVALAKYECEVDILHQTTKSMQDECQDVWYDFEESRRVDDPAPLLRRVLTHFATRNNEIDYFSPLEDKTIVHFRKITFRNNGDAAKLEEKISAIARRPEKEKQIDILWKENKRLEYDRQLRLLDESKKFTLGNQNIRIRYLANHYYNPLITSEAEKIDYLNHIITVESEVKFIDDMAEYLKENKDNFQNVDWWMFSKLDESVDDIYIPYYSSKTHKIAKFFPDFIFWLQKGVHQTILFVDPKGTEHADAYRKIDGYERIFKMATESKMCSEYLCKNMRITVKLAFISSGGTAEIPEKYREYWYGNFNDFAKKKMIYCACREG